MNDDRTTAPAASTPGHLPVRMRGPADMAEMLPYLLGFFPDDSIVAVGLQGPALEQGGVIRIDIPESPETWPRVAADTARLLAELSEQRDRRPEQVLLYLCRDPEDPGGPDPGGARVVLERLRPLAKALARAFESEGVLVKESLCVSGGRWWSYLCAGESCCDPAGTAVRPPHLPSPLAAAATYAGLAPRGSRKAIVAGLAPVGPPLADTQRRAIEDAGPPFIRELSGPAGRTGAVERTAELLAEVMAEFQAGARDLDAARTARLLVGLQDRLGRDRGAEYAEPEELVTAQRLWRYLVQRCVSPFEHLAAPPLTLLAWTSWLGGDYATARIVLSRALDLDPGYTLAQLLYESLNGGLSPEKLLESVRRERAARVGPRRGTDAGRRPEASGGSCTADERPGSDGPVGSGAPVGSDGSAGSAGPVGSDRSVGSGEPSRSEESGAEGSSAGAPPVPPGAARGNRRAGNEGRTGAGGGRAGVPTQRAAPNRSGPRGAEGGDVSGGPVESLAGGGGAGGVVSPLGPEPDGGVAGPPAAGPEGRRRLRLRGRFAAGPAHERRGGGRGRWTARGRAVGG